MQRAPLALRLALPLRAAFGYRPGFICRGCGSRVRTCGPTSSGATRRSQSHVTALVVAAVHTHERRPTEAVLSFSSALRSSSSSASICRICFSRGAVRKILGKLTAALQAFFQYLLVPIRINWQVKMHETRAIRSTALTRPATSPAQRVTASDARPPCRRRASRTSGSDALIALRSSSSAYRGYSLTFDAGMCPSGRGTT